MAFWSGEKLAERLPKIVKESFSEDKIDCSAYTLTVGPEAYITPDHKVQNPSRHTAAKLDKEDSIAIPAGQFGFLLTNESISMPNDAMAFISMKAKLKFRGLINVSGFHVDPGFKGRLIFSVFNAGPRPLHVKRGDDLFLIWFADLDRMTNKNKNNVPLDNISSELINGISGEIQSAHSLSEKMESIDRRLNERIEEVNRSVIKSATTITIVVTILLGVGIYLLKDVVSNEVATHTAANIDNPSSLNNSSQTLKDSNDELDARKKAKSLKKDSLEITPAEPTGK